MSRDQSTTPISYAIDKMRGVIFEVWLGDITADDLEHFWTEFLTNHEVLALRKTLVDLRGANLRFTGKELSNLVANVAVPLLGGRDWKSAFVVERPAQFGVTRQYQVFAEQFSTDSIFHDYDEAVRWLLQPGDRITG